MCEETIFLTKGKHHASLFNSTRWTLQCSVLFKEKPHSPAQIPASAPSRGRAGSRSRPLGADWQRRGGATRAAVGVPPLGGTAAGKNKPRTGQRWLKAYEDFPAAREHRGPHSVQLEIWESSGRGGDGGAGRPEGSGCLPLTPTGRTAVQGGTQGGGVRPHPPSLQRTKTQGKSQFYF